MAHHFFALFDDSTAAAAAIRELRQCGLDQEQLSILRHRDGLPKDEELELVETNAREGFADGALIGALGGAAATSLIAGPLGLLGLGTFAAAVFGAGLGSLYGSLGVGLVSLGLPDRTLEGWDEELEKGKVFLTFTAADAEVEAKAEAILQRHAETQRKHLV